MKIALSIPGFENVDSAQGLPKGVPTGGLFDTGVDIIGVAISLVIVIAVFLSLFTIFRGASDIITSEGNKERFHKGRDRVIYALLGLVVIFLSFFIVNAISQFVGVDLLSFYK